MSHIPGHIDTESQSTGILSPCKIKDNGELEKVESCQLIFIPPSSWNPGKKEKIGFHLLTIHCHGEEKLIAYDVVKWENHVKAEEIAQAELKTTESLEHYFYQKKKDFEDPKKVKDLINKIHKKDESGLGRNYSDVVEKTITYVKSNDFNKFYVNAGEIKDTNSVVDWIIENKNSILEPTPISVNA